MEKSKTIINIRKGQFSRKTNETDININIEYPAEGKYNGNTGLGFFDHMLQNLAKHSHININIECKGDLEVDDHHLIEDIGICFGKALYNSIANNMKITRFGYAYVPMDESLSRTVIDISGRPFCHFKCDFKRDTIKDLSMEMIEHFFTSLANNMMATIHIENLYGNNTHHQCESIFKSFALSLRIALENLSENSTIPSTKGKI